METMIEYGDWIEQPNAAARVWWVVDGEWVHKGWLMKTLPRWTYNESTDVSKNET